MADYQPGDRVVVRDLGLPCHYRIPVFVRGLTGIVEQYCGAHPNPEAIAYGDRNAPNLDLYRVRFKQTDVWPDYDGNPGDTLFVEIYEHWLRTPREDNVKGTTDAA